MSEPGGGKHPQEHITGSEFNPRIVDIETVEEAREEMKRIGADGRGISFMDAKSLSVAIAVENLPAPAVHILKQEMLATGGEAVIPRSVFIKDQGKAQALLLGTLNQFRRAVKKLNLQPLGLERLAQELEGVLESRFGLDRRYNTLEVADEIWDFRERTFVMGVLNVTPDSFYDGGRYDDLQAARERAQELESEGADIIDVGGESTRPGSDPVELEEEITRTVPLIKDLSSRLGVPISIDTHKAEVARRALDAGAAMVNDISALRLDTEMGKLVAERGVPLVIMHMQGTPKVMQENPRYENLMGEIILFFRRQVEVAIEAGVDPGRIVIDPGIGFGKTVAHNLEIMRRLGELKSLPFPLLVGTSRKSFIGAVLDLPSEERLEGTAATVAFAISRGADMVRVHDVGEMMRVARMADAMAGKASKER